MEPKVEFTAAERAKFGWLIGQYERNTDRYMAHEKYLLDLATMPWWKRLYLRVQIVTYLNKHYKKYPAPSWEAFFSSNQP